MSREELVEAEIIAAHMLCSRVRKHDVRKAIRDKFGCSYNVSTRIVTKVRREQKERALAAREEMQRDAHATLDEAIALAFKKKDVRGVIHAVRAQCEIGGLLGSELHLVSTPEKQAHWLEGKGELDVNAQAVWSKDFDELSGEERGVLVQVLRGRGDDELADEVQSKAN